MQRLASIFYLIAALILSSCAAARPANYVPKERRSECEEHCTGLDMTLSAVVIIANMTGCVCEPMLTSADLRSSGSGVAAGGAAIAIAIQQQRQQAAAQAVQQSQH